jgi:hypothetical protein
MKNIALTLTSLIAVILLGNQAIADDIVLSAAQVTKLFTDRTMTVELVKQKDEPPFRVYTASDGMVRNRHNDEDSDNRTWKTSENGRFCISRTFRRQRLANASGSTCGFIVTDGSGVFRLYESKKVTVESGQLVGVERNDLLLNFSSFSAGNTLK